MKSTHACLSNLLTPRRAASEETQTGQRGRMSRDSTHEIKQVASDAEMKLTVRAHRHTCHPGRTVQQEQGHEQDRFNRTNRKPSLNGNPGLIDEPPWNIEVKQQVVIREKPDLRTTSGQINAANVETPGVELRQNLRQGVTTPDP